jgi:hypothetical protein
MNGVLGFWLKVVGGKLETWPGKFEAEVNQANLGQIGGFDLSFDESFLSNVASSVSTT